MSCRDHRVIDGVAVRPAGQRATCRRHQPRRRREREQDTELVFTTPLGSKMDAANIRRDLRRALALVPGSSCPGSRGARLRTGEIPLSGRVTLRGLEPWINDVL